jgi:hypothetical protein
MPAPHSSSAPRLKHLAHTISLAHAETKKSFVAPGNARICDMSDLLFQVPASHLYPGLVIGCDGASLHPEPINTGSTDTRSIDTRSIDTGARACLLTFDDGVVAPAWLLGERDGVWRLDVAAYATAKKTRVAARAWRLVADGETPPDEAGSRRRFRVAARLQPG